MIWPCLPFLLLGWKGLECSSIWPLHTWLLLVVCTQRLGHFLSWSPHLKQLPSCSWSLFMSVIFFFIPWPPEVSFLIIKQGPCFCWHRGQCLAHNRDSIKMYWWKKWIIHQGLPHRLCLLRLSSRDRYLCVIDEETGAWLKGLREET